jgi:hypothetical protein
MSAIRSPAVLPAQAESEMQARHSNANFVFGRQRLIPRACHRNVAMTTRNHGRDAVKRRGRFRTGRLRCRLTSAADAAQALVERIVFAFHLLDRFIHRLCGGVGFAGPFRGKLTVLPGVTPLPIGFIFDEPALFHRGMNREGTEQGGK